MWNVELHNGVTKPLNLRLLNQGEVARLGYTGIFYSDQPFFLATPVANSQILDYVLAGQQYDTALPIPFVLDYQRRHGEFPRGVWLYDGGDAWGRFYDFVDAYILFWQAVNRAWQERGDEQALPPDAFRGKQLNPGDICCRCLQPIEHADPWIYCGNCR